MGKPVSKNLPPGQANADLDDWAEQEDNLRPDLDSHPPPVPAEGGVQVGHEGDQAPSDTELPETENTRPQGPGLNPLEVPQVGTRLLDRAEQENNVRLDPDLGPPSLPAQANVPVPIRNAGMRAVRVAPLEMVHRKVGLNLENRRNNNKQQHQDDNSKNNNRYPMTNSLANTQPKQ